MRHKQAMAKKMWNLRANSFQWPIMTFKIWYDDAVRPIGHFHANRPERSEPAPWSQNADFDSGRMKN